MSDWITNRQPTEADADSDGEVIMLRRSDGRVNSAIGVRDAYVDWRHVGPGVPWKRSKFTMPPATEPEPQPAPEPAATDRPALAVGQTWRRRDAEVVTIERYDPATSDCWPFWGSDGHMYQPNGRFWDDTVYHPRDLVELINEAPEPAPVSPARRIVSISRTVLSNGDHILDAIDDQGTAWWRRLDTSPHHPAFPAPESKWQQLSPLPAREVPAQ